jgi:hypothetical protein
MNNFKIPQPSFSSLFIENMQLWGGTNSVHGILIPLIFMSGIVFLVVMYFVLFLLTERAIKIDVLCTT